MTETQMSKQLFDWTKTRPRAYKATIYGLAIDINHEGNGYRVYVNGIKTWFHEGEPISTVKNKVEWAVGTWRHIQLRRGDHD